MMIDTEMRISGDSAIEFRNMMRSIDLDAISLRDEFIDGVESSMDESGVLSIDISDMDIDLSVLEDIPEVIESVLVPKTQLYVGQIKVKFSADDLTNLRIKEADASYTMVDIYVSSGTYSVGQSESFQYAA